MSDRLATCSFTFFLASSAPVCDAPLPADLRDLGDYMLSSHLPRFRKTFSRGTCGAVGTSRRTSLWGEQNTLRNILGCMPSSSVQDIQANHPPHIRAAHATDWERPLVYSHRVRSLTSMSLLVDNELRDILSFVSSSFPGDCLLPNLKTLRWIGSGDDFFYMRMALAPTLTHPTAIFAPSCTDGDGDSARSVVSDLTCMLGDIESLNIDVPDLAALEHLARLPTLTCLTVRSFPAASPSTSPLHFPALNRLEFDLDNIYPATKFLPNFSDVSLVGLDLTLHYWYPSTALEKFCTAPKAACTHTSLLSLSIDDGQADDISGSEDEDAFTISIQSIQALFCFRNLTSVVIASKLGFDLDNFAITDLACAWLHVTTLFLISETQRRPHNSLDCLYSLAQHCPELERLHITFDTSRLPSNASVSPIAAPTLSVARVISALFPGLEDLSTDCIGDEDDDEDEDNDEPRSEVIGADSGVKSKSIFPCSWRFGRNSGCGHGKI
ncbi:hypothetical protein DFH09DRAFT_1492488 [Mycena vulgaris]|nr:hypothetical protein DFH09DRAFT_1492488 [Mycena vulgaris]